LISTIYHRCNAVNIEFGFIFVRQILYLRSSVLADRFNEQDVLWGNFKLTPTTIGQKRNNRNLFDRIVRD